MGGALDELLVLGHELVLDPVHRHRHVAATVDVRVERAAVIDHEALLFVLTMAQEELLRVPRCDLADSTHNDACARITHRDKD